MREIKFRFWKKNTNEMLTLNQALEFLVSVSELIGGKYDNFIPLQYTGLKEIYEGDVVTVRTKYGMDKGVVVFKDGAFMVYWDSTISFPTNGIVKTHYYLNGTNKVLGNIYTNPKLLAGEND